MGDIRRRKEDKWAISRRKKEDKWAISGEKRRISGRYQGKNEVGEKRRISGRYQEKKGG